MKDGRVMYRWGTAGHLYPTKAEAEAQGAAIRASQYAEQKKERWKQMNQPRYKLVKAEDGVIWASLQPLFLDLQEKLDDPQLPKDIAQQLQTVIEFISHLIIEGEQEEAQQ
jgi:hypothetical protein